MQKPENFTPSKDCLQKRVFLVTGAGNGIGLAASRIYAEHGATIIMLDKDVKALESAYDQFLDAGLPEPALYPMDLEGAKDTDYIELAKTLEKEFSHLDGLLHNAARRDAQTPLSQVDLDDWFEILQVNLNAAFMLTQVCLPLLEKAPAASIVFTTDHQSRKHHAYWGAYGISKHAVDGLMLTWADELENQSSVRVNSIDPGAIRTNMRRETYPGIEPDDMVPAETIMDSYLYLMSDDSKAINGEVLQAQQI
ncbi:MAG: YciK family oxidoreductase [Gammaproteobacteria bacterium]|nr:MAG: YciK family oxidoreductase [Gammaproteobacteria bacterium]